MQPVTILGLALCLGVIFLRARQAKQSAETLKSPGEKSTASRAGTLKRRFKTAHLLLAALVAWLVINMQLQHLNHALSGEAQAPQSLWERVIQTLSDWI